MGFVIMTNIFLCCWQQLLVLVLQIVATLALEPQHHRALIDQGLPDVLSQLLLPSDEWYYTNHSTKYARFVKHHAARTLVYLGLQHRVNLRFSVYDILQGEFIVSFLLYAHRHLYFPSHITLM